MQRPSSNRAGAFVFAAPSLVRERPNKKATREGGFFAFRSVNGTDCEVSRASPREAGPPPLLARLYRSCEERLAQPACRNPSSADDVPVSGELLHPLFRKGLHGLPSVGVARSFPETLVSQFEMCLQVASRQATAQWLAAGQWRAGATSVSHGPMHCRSNRQRCRRQAVKRRMQGNENVLVEAIEGCAGAMSESAGVIRPSIEP
jgi:hypothetical protein